MHKGLTVIRLVAISSREVEVVDDLVGFANFAQDLVDGLDAEAVLQVRPPASLAVETGRLG